MLSGSASYQELALGHRPALADALCGYMQLFTGKGVLGQVGLYTGLSRPVVQALVFGLVVFNYLSATNPR